MNDAVFERVNIPIGGGLEKTFSKPTSRNIFTNKPLAVGGNTVKNPFYENLKLQKREIFDYFGEERVQWLVNEMLEIETFLKNYFFKQD